MTGRIFKLWCLLLMTWQLAACGDWTNKRFEEMLPKQQVAQAEQMLELLTNKDFVALKAQFDPEFVGPTFDSDLQNMRALLPDGKPLSTKTVGSFTQQFNNEWTSYNISFEQQFPDRWALVAVQLREKNGALKLIGMNVKPLAQSLESAAAFNFAGKGAAHYLVLALAVLVPVFVVFTLVVCYRTPMAKRKWLWMLFIAFGVTRLVFDWSTGGWGWQPLGFNLLGAGFVRAGPYAPYILSLGFPLGALVFWFRRRSFLHKAATVPVVAPPPEQG